ncbi:Putative LOC100650169 [Caligus rogercresseyi]|uniref:LOC100650169 n=1 Tax=Caligus rogercresseyi TaxID=217165 RepID=A0A7T8GKR3_CALRO|nr:Putative LOC100650169 [Caligus rogercresseyi]
MPSPKSSSCSSSSGPSSMESQPHLYNKTLVVIEKSNSDLEHTLQSRVYNGCGGNATTTPNNCSQPPPRIDTIHNNRNLTQEVIYEVESLLGDDEERCRGGHEKDVCTEEETIFVPSKLSSASSSFSKPLSSPPLQTSASSASVEYPSVTDLSMKDISNQSFKSLTAQKLMAGLSFNSIDTLLEVNAAAEVRNRINESTETIDFGVI